MCPDKQEGRMRERHRKQCCGHTRTNKKESNEEWNMVCLVTREVKISESQCDHSRTLKDEWINSCDSTKNSD